MKRRFEMVTNIVVLAVTLLVGYRFLEGFFVPHALTIKAG